MKIYVVGNSLIKEDSLPLKMLPELKKAFPKIEFIEADPNDNFLPEEGAIILDTVIGIDKVKLFDSLDAFVTTKSVSTHDYDLGMHLKLLRKLGKIRGNLPAGRQVRVIGVPMKKTKEKILPYLHLILRKWVAQDMQGS